MVAMVSHHRVGNVDFLRDRSTWMTGLIMGGGGVAVAVGAALLAVKLDKSSQNMLNIAIAAMVVLIGLFMLLGSRLRIKFRWRNVGVLAAIAAFNKAFTGGGYGPLVCGGQVLSGLNVRVAVATTCMAESLVCISTTITFLAKGIFAPAAVYVPLIVGCLLGPPTSAVVLRRMSTGFIQRIVAITIVVLGTLALLKKINGV
jgi:uncharacterized membrane protein YfcA